VKTAIWLVFMFAVVASGGPAIMLGAAVVALVAWIYFWLL
jgi:hypothetical protein